MVERVKINRSLGVPDAERAERFLRALADLCRSHGIWIGHEDWHGAFELQRASTEEWLMAARPVESFEEVIVPASGDGA